MPEVDYRQGDYRTVAERLLPAARQLVEACAPVAGQRVVDVAAGSGNVAHLCRARGADVVAVDRVLEQLQLGRTGGDGIAWVVGDAHALPLPDDSADLVLSTFGLIFASRPDVAVREVGRVCRSGGEVGLTTWSGDHLQRAQYDVFAELLPGRAAGHDHLATWGSEDAVARRLDPVADDLTCRRAFLTRTYASVEAWWADRARSAPPVVTARQHLTAEQFEVLGERMREAAQRFGRTTSDGLVLDDEYLVVVARVR